MAKSTKEMSRSKSNLELQLGGAGMAIYQPGDVYGPYSFNDYEFVWIMEGNVDWEVDGVRQHVPVESLCLMKPGTVQSFFWDEKKQSRHAYFIFSFEKGRRLFPPDQEIPLSRVMQDSGIYKPLFRHILWLCTNPEANRKQLASAICFFLEVFITGVAEAAEDIGQEYPEALVSALRYSRKKWQSGVLHLPTLDELARQSGVSRAQLYRYFMKYFGMGPLTAIRFIRLEEASLRLVRNRLNIKQIAEETGFSSPYHFSKAFKDVYGLSPKDFRKRVQSGEATRPLPKLIQVRQMKRIILED